MLAVSVVYTVLMIIILQIRGPGHIEITDPGAVIASNLGSWIESTIGTNALPGFVMRLARVVDVFNIWIIVLLSIGFSAVSKNMKAITPAMWLAVAYVIFSIINAAIGSVLGS